MTQFALPRETAVFDGQAVPVLIPGYAETLTIAAGTTWSTESLSEKPYLIQFDVEAEIGLRAVGQANTYPLRAGGVYTFGVPAAGLELVAGGSGATVHILTAGA